MITINSKDRHPNSNSTADMIFSNVGWSSVKRFKIEYISLPYSWYNINSKNNSIVVNGTTYSISAGQYTANTLASTLQTLLQGIDATFTVSWSSQTQKFTTSRSTNFTFNLSSSALTLRRQFGFSLTSDQVGTQIVSDSVANLQNSNSISLHSDLLSKALNNQITDTRYQYVMSIPIDQNPGGIITYRPSQDVELSSMRL